MRRPTLSPKTLAVGVATLVALTVGFASYAVGAWPRLENETLDMRFGVRGPTRAPPEVVVVAIDEKTFSDLRLQWPFPRSLGGAVIDRLHADGALAIAYDVQFTEPRHSP